MSSTISKIRTIAFYLNPLRIDLHFVHDSFAMSIVDRIGLTRKITRPRQRAFFERFATETVALDIGCGNDIYGDLFPSRVTADIVAREGVKVDIIADAHDMHMIEDGSYDVIICAEVLEHLHTPHKAIGEFHRILKPGGLLLLTTRFVFPLHDVPHDYYRYTKYGLEHLLRDFTIERFEEEASTMETLAVLLQRIGFQCNTLGFRPLKALWFLWAKLLLIFARIITAEYGDIGHTTKEKNILCSGYYVAARKP